MEQMRIQDKKTEYIITSCAFTGHRELDADVTKRKVKNLIERAYQKGARVFYNGMAMGFDLLAAEQTLALRKKYSDIKLVACIPCYGQEKGFKAEDKKRYVDILRQVDEQVLLSECYYRGCMQVRDKYMIDKADMLIAYCKKTTGGAAYTVGYCKKKYPDKEIVYVNK